MGFNSGFKGLIYAPLSVGYLLCLLLWLGRLQITALTVAGFFKSLIPVMSFFCHLVIISSKWGSPMLLGVWFQFPDSYTINTLVLDLLNFKMEGIILQCEMQNSSAWRQNSRVVSYGMGNHQKSLLQKSSQDLFQKNNLEILGTWKQLAAVRNCFRVVLQSKVLHLLESYCYNSCSQHVSSNIAPYNSRTKLQIPMEATQVLM